ENALSRGVSMYRRCPRGSRPSNRHPLRDKRAVTDVQLTALEDARFPSMAFPVEAQLAGHRCIVEDANEAEQVFAGFRLALRDLVVVRGPVESSAACTRYRKEVIVRSLLLGNIVTLGR